MDLKILDCTFRDGGHLNKWVFDPRCVRACYNAAVKAGVDYFEVGYRVPDHFKGLGDFAYCRDPFLEELIIPQEGCAPTIMIDAGKWGDALPFPACRPENTLVRAVRTACFPSELPKAFDFVAQLNELGYQTFLNLMASSQLGKREIDQLAAWPGKDRLTAVYFADSFGSFLPKDVRRQVERLKGAGFANIGFHPHNSLQLAFANMLEAVESGVRFVDASLYGMGRGSGNLPIELWIGYLEKQGRPYNTVPYLDVLERWFLDLHRKIGWGYDVKTLMSGLMDIHPYYMEYLFQSGLYTVQESWNALPQIKEKCPVSYSAQKLEQMLDERFYTPLTRTQSAELAGSVMDQERLLRAADAPPVEGFPLDGRHAGEAFLILATGDTVKDFQAPLQAFTRANQCVTIGVNELPPAFSPDYHLFVNRKRFLTSADNVSPNSHLLVPAFFGREFIDEAYRGASPVSFFNVSTPCAFEQPPLENGTLHCTVPNVATVAILAAAQMGAREIFVAGMDGYVREFNNRVVKFINEEGRADGKEVASLRYQLLAQELERVNRFLEERAIPFSIITPTSHKTYYRTVREVLQATSSAMSPPLETPWDD